MTLEINGPTKLRGSVRISGAKNAALPCMFATLLSDEKTILGNTPDVADIATAAAVLEALDKKVVCVGDQLEVAQSGDGSSTEVPGNLARSMRASILALGPLLAKRMKASVPLPGGCDFGERPIDIHIKGLEEMGAAITMADDTLQASTEGLVGCELNLKFPTFTGTENLMMAATLAKGTTTITNAAREPEVKDLADMLVAMGAKISGAGTSTIVIEGIASLSGCAHKVMPDRIEAGTYMAATVAAGGEVTLVGADDDGSGPVHELLRQAGAQIQVDGDMLTVRMEQRPKSMSFTTEPYPGFPTDLQAQIMAVNSVAKGCATISENVWAQRFRTAKELGKLGAKIEIKENKAYVTGVEKLNGAHVIASDLRASAALVVAGICAQGTTIIEGVEHLQRGYADLPAKLRSLGADVELIEPDDDSVKLKVSQNR